MKLAKIIPVPKSKCSRDVKDYRPVSLLAGVSKIMERVIAKHMHDFTKENEILTSTQHGFRKGFSTASAVQTLTDDIYKGMDNGKLTACLYVDLSKAFDLIDHDILLQKLFHYGFRGNFHRLLVDYLTGRTFLHHVDWNGQISQRFIMVSPREVSWVPYCSLFL